ncbi:RHS repeat-associated core domain-containing protein [Terrisporobacter glycolicus]|nr:RHS repeat-associated core domain-containing protein [Terrisporobacter glycolicus]
MAYDYDDFGVTRSIGDSAFFNEICYTGAIYDVSTGLYYLNARYYDPKNGRFITRDTYRGEINEPSSLHLYAYCANNPINYVDPSGHRRIKIRLKMPSKKTVKKVCTIIAIVAGIVGFNMWLVGYFVSYYSIAVSLPVAVTRVYRIASKIAAVAGFISSVL